MKLRVLVLLALVAVTLFAFAGVGYAQVEGPKTEQAVRDLFDGAQLFAFIGGVFIPFIVALLAKAQASAVVKSALAVISAALLALGLYLADVGGGQTWKGAVSVFVIALVSAAASRVTVTGGADTALQQKTGDFGIG